MLVKVWMFAPRKQASCEDGREQQTFAIYKATEDTLVVRSNITLREIFSIILHTTNIPRRVETSESEGILSLLIQLIKTLFFFRYLLWFRARCQPSSCLLSGKLINSFTMQIFTFIWYTSKHFELYRSENCLSLVSVNYFVDESIYLGSACLFALWMLQMLQSKMCKCHKTHESQIGFAVESSI